MTYSDEQRDKLWNTTLQLIWAKDPHISVKTALIHVKPLTFDLGTLVLVIANEFDRDAIKSELHDELMRTITEQTGIDPITIIYHVDNRLIDHFWGISDDTPIAVDQHEIETSEVLRFAYDRAHPKEPSQPVPMSQEGAATLFDNISQAAPQPEPSPSTERVALGEAKISKSRTFDNFVTGPSNHLAIAAAIAVTKNPASAYNPLFIYGESGLGKTHLLSAIANGLREYHPELNVLYVGTDELSNEYIDTFRAGRYGLPVLMRKYMDIDVLLMDDVQALEGKESTQTHFFNIFNELHQREKQIVLTSDRPPAKLTGLTDRLRSRFEWGLNADVKLPDFEMRVAILESKCRSSETFIDDYVLTHIAQRVTGNIRNLEGALTRILFGASIFKGPITTDFVDEQLEQLYPKAAVIDITPDLIKRETAAYFGVSLADINSKSRSSHIVYARHVAIYLCREMTTLSFPNIGKQFGRDHSTIQTSYSKIAAGMGADTTIVTDVDKIRNRIMEVNEP